MSQREDQVRPPPRGVDVDAALEEESAAHDVEAARHQQVLVPSRTPGARAVHSALQVLYRFRGLYLPVALVVVWQLLAMAGRLDATLAPSPEAVLRAAWIWMFGERSSIAWYSGTWFANLTASSMRALTGFFIAAVLGGIFGILIGWYRLFADIVDPFLQWMRPVPVTAWLPFTAMVFGIRNTGAIALIVLGAFFPVLVNTTAGVRATPEVLVRAALMLGTSRSKLLHKVALPAALPSIITGLRLGLGIAWVLVVVSELLAVRGGLGYALWSAYQYSRMDLIFSVIVTLGVLGLVSDRLLILLTRPLLRGTQGVWRRQ